MGRGQELLDAARKDDRYTVEKIIAQLSKRSGPFPSLRRRPGVNVKDDSDYTPLHHAALNGHKEIVELLLASEASPCHVDKIGATPLHLAAFNGHAEVVALLLAHNTPPVNIDQLTHTHDTALLMAAGFGHTAVVSMLLSRGADASIKNLNDMNALDLAAQFDKKDVVKVLLRMRPQLIDPYRNPREGKIFKHTPLHRASKHGRDDVVKALLSEGVYPNLRTENGTPLHEAVCFARKSVVQTLLKAGANLRARNSDGRTVVEMLADYPEDSMMGVRQVIREYQSHYAQKCTTYDSEEELPPFPVADSPPAHGSGRRRWDDLEGTSEGDALSISSAASSCAPLHLIQHYEHSKVSPTPPKKPPRRNLSVSPTHANSPSSGYSYELRVHARSQDDLDDIQGAKHYLKHGRSVDHYESKLSYSEYEESHHSPRVAPIPNPRPSLKQRSQPVAITAMYENVVIKEQNPRRKLRRNVQPESYEPRTIERVRKYSNQERSSLESLLDDQSMNSPSDGERYCEGPRVEVPLSPSHYEQPPTPEHPPPSAKHAENSIHERIRPLSQLIMEVVEEIRIRKKSQGDNIKS